LSSIEITLTAGNINQGHFYIPRSSSIFPENSWGGKNESEAGKQVEINFEGTSELAKTDIDGTKRLFRNTRGESKRFLKHHKLKEGDVIFISKSSDNKFKVSTEILKEGIKTSPIDSLVDISTSRKDTIVSRIIRDTAISKKIKKLYSHKCQVCNLQISTPKGHYAEGAHIKALGEPHNGPDTEANILCLCPNHHVMFDKGCFTINNDLTFNGIEGRLIVNKTHSINTEYLEHHKNNA
jgi:predicted restriction endonuclease